MQTTAANIPSSFLQSSAVEQVLDIPLLYLYICACIVVYDVFVSLYSFYICVHLKFLIICYYYYLSYTVTALLFGTLACHQTCLSAA